MQDLIDRQAAIDFIDAGRFVNPNEPRWSDNEVVNFLKADHPHNLRLSGVRTASGTTTESERAMT